MKKSLVLLAILAPAVLAADVASAAKSYQQCGAAFAACQIGCTGQKVFQDACFNRCESNRKTCAANVASGGKGKIVVGGNVVVTPTKSGRGSIPIQTGPNVVVNQTPTRPAAGGNPCTVHCGPLGSRKK